MANTYDSTILNTLISQVVLNSEAVFAPLKTITLDLSEEMVPKNSAVVVSYGETGSTTKNPTNLETTSDSLSAIPLNLDLYHKSFAITQKDLEMGRSLERVWKLNLESITQDIMADFNTILRVANFAAIYNSTASAIGEADIRTAWGAIETPVKSIALADQLYAKFIGAGALNLDITKLFDNQARHNFSKGSPTANTKGFVYGPDAVVGAFRLPAFPADKYDKMEVVVTSFGLPILYTEHYSLASGSYVGAFSVLGSFAVGNKASGKLIIAS